MTRLLPGQRALVSTVQVIVRADLGPQLWREKTTESLENVFETECTESPIALFTPSPSAQYIHSFLSLTSRKGKEQMLVRVFFVNSLFDAKNTQGRCSFLLSLSLLYFLIPASFTFLCTVCLQLNPDEQVSGKRTSIERQEKRAKKRSLRLFL